MRSLALAVFLLSIVGCSKGRGPQPSQDAAPPKGAKPAQKAPEVPVDLLFEAVGANYRGQPEVLRHFQNGLVTEDFVLGKGEGAQVGSRLTLRYAGILDNGVVFDENRSPQRKPFRFRLPQSPRVRGWGQGLLGMKAGGRRKITVPAKLGYGAAGDPGEPGTVPVPPNARLTYVVELIELEPPPPKPQDASAFSGPVLARKKHKNGLETQDFRLGSGPACASGDRVAIHYRGYLKDGSTFDASVLAGAPFRFKIGDRMVLPAWSQGIAGMKPGGLRVLKVPAKLAYGKGGTQGVPPNADLSFAVEMVSLQKPAPPKKPGE